LVSLGLLSLGIVTAGIVVAGTVAAGIVAENLAPVSSLGWDGGEDSISGATLSRRGSILLIL
jgi:hypothetical protein